MTVKPLGARSLSSYRLGVDEMRGVIDAEQIDGSMSREELTWLAGNAARHHRIVEIGSWAGRSAKVMANATPGVLRAVDRWDGREDLFEAFQRNLAGEIKAGKLIPMRAWSLDAATELEQMGETFDMIFIDADHAEDAVRKDFAAWWPLLTPGGLMCGHDYHPREPGVIRAVDGLLRGGFARCDTIWHFRKIAVGI